MELNEAGQAVLGLVSLALGAWLVAKIAQLIFLAWVLKKISTGQNVHWAFILAGLLIGLDLLCSIS